MGWSLQHSRGTPQYWADWLKVVLLEVLRVVNHRWMEQCEHGGQDWREVLFAQDSLEQGYNKRVE